ncbi:MAG: hypothetical protein K2O24_00790 [Muribaculaceae bacterium]|nr:hypothetical protein [Muribaculaceae bacterium]
MNDTPTLIHSFWSRPLELGLFGVDGLNHLAADVWMFALSAGYAERCGFRIELHTDSFGARLLEHLPYQDIHLTLDDIPDYISPRFWAAGKIEALAAAGPGAVHIDGDVMIKSPQLLYDVRRFDVFCQESEPDPAWMFSKGYGPRRWHRFVASRGLHPGLGYTFNTGVVCINSERLLDKYVGYYRTFTSKASELFGPELRRNAYFVPDLFAEQYALASLCKLEGASAGFILDRSAGVPKGYQHLITAEKYSPACRAKVRQSLRMIFPELYYKTEKIWKNI